jgi:hypothetical protein
VDTTDTHTFAEYNSANRGKFGITFAYRIGDNTERKRAAGFLSVPFEPPAERPPTVSALAQKTRWSWLWIVGTGLSSRGQTKSGKNIVVAYWVNDRPRRREAADGHRQLRNVAGNPPRLIAYRLRSSCSGVRSNTPRHRDPPGAFSLRVSIRLEVQNSNAAGHEEPATLPSSPSRAFRSPHGIGRDVEPVGEDGLLIFTRWSDQQSLAHRLSTGKQIALKRFSDEVCVWLPSNTDEET